MKLLRVRHLDLSEILWRVRTTAGRLLGGVQSEIIGRRRPSRADDSAIPGGTLQRLVSMPEIRVLMSQLDQLSHLGEFWLRHHFDLLGSGWSSVSYGARCRGVEGNRYSCAAIPQPDSSGEWLADVVHRADLDESIRIWKLIEQPYEAIDWQLDFKSGFRWSSKKPSDLVSYGGHPGADIKVPWELARLQHLPGLAICYALAQDRSTGLREPDRYLSEVRNQMLDFAATNPPGWGVNWRCAMDVAIRLANLIVAWSLLESVDANLDSEFEAVYRKTLLDHGRYIAANLEWRPRFRNNHYLADLVGLAFVGAHLCGSAEADDWLELAARELIRETELQFHEDGSNVEASTAYHRLSTELVLWGTAVLMHAQQRLETSIPKSHFERLERSIEFSKQIVRPDGAIVQFGDNDSGRLFKFSRKISMVTPERARQQFCNLDGWELPFEIAVVPIEDQLTMTEIIACGSRLLGQSLEADADEDWARVTVDVFDSITTSASDLPHSERSCRDSRLSRRCVSKDKASIPRAPTEPEPSKMSLLTAKKLLNCKNFRRYWFGAREAGLKDDIRHAAFPDFGLYVIQSERLYLAIRCGSFESSGTGGHAHNDQLALELILDCEPVIRDPGTYLYTPIPAERNRYRSVSAHFAPSLSGKEPSDLGEGIFRLRDTARAECLEFGDGVFVGRHSGYGELIWRHVKVRDTGVEVLDWYEGAESLAEWNPPPFSPGYGIRERIAGPLLAQVEHGSLPW